MGVENAKKQRESASYASGFSLIELMVVVAIVAILGAFAVPAYQDYVVRTRVAEVLSWSEGVKKQIVDNMANGLPFNSGLDATKLTGTGLPKALQNADISIAAGFLTLWVKSPVGVKSLLLIPKVNTGVGGSKVFIGTATDSVIMEGRISWSCRSLGTDSTWSQGSLPGKYAPAECSGTPLE